MLVRIQTRSVLSAVALLAGIVFSLCTAESAFAQGAGYLNFGSRPALSPYLGMLNRPTGPIDPYNQYVRPRIEAQQIMDRQQAQLNRQGYQQQTMMRSQRSAVGTQTGAPTAGRVHQAATFRNYSHYYPSKTQ